MSSLITYYTWVGNTGVVANEIQRQTGFDIKKIEELKERKPGNFIGSAMGAVFNMKSKLKPFDFSLAGYDEIYLGVQVWASKTTPAINTFLSKVDLKGKKVRLFITLADDKEPIKFIESVKNRVEKKGGVFVDSIFFTVSYVPGKTEVVSPEAVKDKIGSWLNKE